jgi:type III restriction enzyme
LSRMSKSKQFHYDIQPHQEDCVQSIIQVFEQLQQRQPFAQVLNAHHAQHRYSFPIKDNHNIDIMMETGTGKTFAFIKTIFELNRQFGYQKFIILIPSVPIREGTKTNLEDTKDYFKSLYANERDKEIETFVYEGGNIAAVRQFINTQHLSVLVMTPSSFDKDKNKLNQPLQNDIYQPELFVGNDAPPASYLECLKRLKPIIIMDEPHRFEGDAFKKYFEGFDNYYLRFGATFPKKKDSLGLSNVAYVLDSISAFRQCLVKKIVVYTQDVADKADTLMSIEGKKAIVHTLSHGVIIKRELGIGGLFNDKSVQKINKDSLVLSDRSIEKIEYALTDDAQRAMIAQTIRIHFEKERTLYEQGIKALTLFFMEADINLYRGENPKIKTLFEEEYAKQYQAILEQTDSSSDYYRYLQASYDADSHLNVHKGYFSGDKGNKDEKIKAGVDEILKEKKKLLSFDNPTRFIFSIWALQEGWDNPNVFTICKLSNQGSDISKLQQIGRGLRICVNQNLERKTLSRLDNDREAFWGINNLDVVVSNKEQGFVESIQNEILSNSYLVGQTFSEQELKISLKEKARLDDAEVRKLYRLIEDKEMIVFKETINGLDVFEKSPDFAKILREADLPEPQHKALETIFATDAASYIQKGENKDKQKKKKVFIKTTHLKAFQTLWHNIHKNAQFYVENLNAAQEQQLITNIKTEINALTINEVFLQTIKADLKVDTLGKADGVSTTVVQVNTNKSKVDYLGLVNTVSAQTKTPLRFVVKVFNALSTEFKTVMLANNPAQAQKEISAIIQKHLIAMLKTQVRYDGLDGTISGKALPNVFKTENGKTYLKEGSVGKYQKDIDSSFSLKEKWVFEEVIEYDSDFELDIIEGDPDMAEIEIFGKLPRLEIKTPLGNYNPDFCYAIKSKAKNEANQVILVVESKGYHAVSDIPDDEKAKIDFAKQYFEALNAHYQAKGSKIRISYKERINRTQLAALILS